MTTNPRVLPVVAERLEAGDAILCDHDGQVHVARGEAVETRILRSVEVLPRDDKKPTRVALTDHEGREWLLWDKDVAWLIVPTGATP